MVLRALRLFGFGVGVGIGIGVAADRVAVELRKPAADQFPWLRERVNGTVNPWLLEHHIPGHGRAEIGTLEHVGRVSGIAHVTPVHPTLRGDEVLVPAPLGVGSQWARNVLAGGRARLRLHDTLYELEHPELIEVGETGFYPPWLAAPFDRMGWRYVRLRVASSAPAAFSLVHATDGLPDPPQSEPLDVPREPRMVDRPATETAPA